MKLPMLDVDAVCPKCGGAEFTYVHRQVGEALAYGPPRPPYPICELWGIVRIEHVEKRCDRCNYEQFCAPMDSLRESTKPLTEDHLEFPRFLSVRKGESE